MIRSSALVLACVTAASTVTAAATLHVSPEGNDGWSGRLSAADAAAADGPLASLERARDEVRRIKQAGNVPPGGIAVELHGGVYEVGQTLRLGEGDSGSKEAPVTIRAAAGESVVLLGGKVVTGFRPVTDPDVSAVLDPAARGHVLQADLRAQGVSDFGSPAGGGMELFFRGKPMTVSRWPNDGFVRIVEMVGEAEKRDRHMTHKVGKWTYDGDRPKRWLKEKEVWVHGYWFHDWSEQRHKVKTIDPENRTIEVEPPYHGYGYRKGKWYYAYNLLSEIDTPGEWHVDRAAGLLYFWPPEPVRDGDAVVSILPSLVAMDEVSHVTLRGLVFEGTRGTGLSMSGGEGNRVEACTFRNLGGWAVRVSGGRGHHVVGCDVYQTGAGGIGINGGDRKTLTPAGHVAENNHVHHYARIKRVYQPGITLHGVGNRAVRNLIHNAPHMAMGFGGNDHTIELNEIHSVCFESNDAGAIYTGRDWTCRGHVIRNNYLHHINGFEGRGCVGVYLDDSFSSADIVGNVFYKVTRAAMIGGGRDNSIANNIFVDCRPAVHVDARGIGWANRYIVPGGGWNMQKKLADLPYQQPPWTKYPHLGNILDDEPYLPKYNVVARNIIVGEGWDGISKDARPHVTMQDNLINEDAGLVDPANADFRLREDAPALRLGFQPIPLKRIGLYEDARRASWPVTHEVRPMATPPPKQDPKRGPVPVCKVGRSPRTIVVDGTLGADERDGLRQEKALVVAQGIRGEALKPASRAWCIHDGTALYVGIRNEVSAREPLKTEPQWGENDAVEVAVRGLGLPGGPILVLRGFPKGQFESSTEAGAPFEVAKGVGEAVTYAAKVVNEKEWTAEWRIPFAAIGVDLTKHKRIPLNLSVRKTAALQWMMWRGTLGYTWQVDQAGVIELQP